MVQFTEKEKSAFILALYAVAYADGELADAEKFLIGFICMQLKIDHSNTQRLEDGEWEPIVETLSEEKKKIFSLAMCWISSGNEKKKELETYQNICNNYGFPLMMFNDEEYIRLANIYFPVPNGKIVAPSSKPAAEPAVDDTDLDNDTDVDNDVDDNDENDWEDCENIEADGIEYSGLASELTASADMLLDENETASQITIPATITDDEDRKWKVTCYEITDGKYSQLTLPSSMAFITGDAFSALPNRKSLSIDLQQNTILEIKDRVIYSNKNRAGEKSYVLCNTQMAELEGTFFIPKGVKIVDDCAFKNQANITTIEFPESLSELGANVFEGCKGLQKIIVHNTKGSVTYWDANIDDSKTLGNSLDGISVIYMGKPSQKPKEEAPQPQPNPQPQAQPQPQPLAQPLQQPKQPAIKPRKCERIMEGKWIGGVCTGLSQYWGMNIWVLRLLFLLLASGGFSIVIYLILMIVMKKES